MFPISIRATNMELTSPISQYVEDKIGGLSKFLDISDTSIRADVEVGQTTKHHKSGNIFRAEVNLRIGGKTLRVVKKSIDLYAAIDSTRDELQRRLKRYKEKKRGLSRKGASRFKEMVRKFARRDNG